MQRAAFACAFALVASVAIAATAIKRAEIGFASGAAEISPIVQAQVVRLVAVLKGDIAAGATIEVQAYARDRATRVLAVKRASDVRMTLIENGMPAERIAVHVVDQPQPADMILIFVRR